jgi:L-threonylcarbamoyladenylate synthase
LLSGGVGVLATDTLYGLVARAEDSTAVESLYTIKGRRPDKPLIILISQLSELKRFGVEVDGELEKKLKGYWPGPVSIILACDRSEWAYLHRGTKTLAFRVPAKPSLRRLLQNTGPLVAPSANPEGFEPARTTTQAKAYFGDKADFYRRGRTRNEPSRVIKIEGETITVLR